MSTLMQTNPAIATSHLVDACMRLKIPYRIAPCGIKSVTAIEGMLAGPAVPVRHYGSVDVFLEVLESAPKGGILVIDNAGRQDEACIGDLVVLEAKHAGLQALVVNGLHRDTAELRQIGLPVFSYGAYPAGPARLDAREPDAMRSARFGNFEVTALNTVFADADGVLFMEISHVEQALRVANTIRGTERQQAEMAMQGVSLREQFQFRAFLQQRNRNAAYTFRQHLSAMAKAIEE